MEPGPRPDHLFFELDPILFVAQGLLRKVRLEAVITGDSGNVFPILIQFENFLSRPGLRKCLGVFESERAMYKRGAPRSGGNTSWDPANPGRSRWDWLRLHDWPCKSPGPAAEAERLPR